MDPKLFALAAASLLLTACGAMLPGSIYTTDGKVMPFEIETSYGSGTVRATDPSTGERFEGTYVGIRERVVATSNATIRGTATSTASISSARVAASGFGTTAISSNIANATAYLKGDKGTMLNCVMQIQAGLSPHGIGGCDDNHGRAYKLQF